MGADRMCVLAVLGPGRASAEGGLTLGVLPGAEDGGGYPNAWVKVAVRTGLGMARNTVNVLSADLCVALGGGPGTLSEIALALKAGREVWCWRSWGLAPPTAGLSMPRVFTALDDLLQALDDRLNGRLPALT